MREILAKSIGWGMYDIGTSAYYLVFPLYLFPVFLSSIVFRGDSRFEMYWGVTQGVAVFLAVAAGLVFGRSFDALGVTRVSAVLMVITPCVLVIIPTLVGLRVGGIALLLGFAIAHGMHLLSLTAYDASLTRVASPGEQRTRISGWAWGWGYLGGVACLAVMEIGLRFYPRYSAWDFAVGNVFYLIASLFAARWMWRQMQRSSSRGEVDGSRDSIHAAGEWRTPWLLLLLMLLMVDGVAVKMIAISLFRQLSIWGITPSVTLDGTLYQYQSG